MDELEISGKRYISTKRAGKDHNYHSDYIGQLIRAKKVTGQKVGRSWYVEADSLATYLGAEKAPQNIQAPIAQVVQTPKEIPSVEPQLTEIAEEEVGVNMEPIVETEPLLVGEEINIDETDAHHIPVKISQPVEEQKEPSPVFYRTTKEAREARGGLRYIADEGPLLPPVKKRVVPYVHSVAPAPVQTKIAAPIFESIEEVKINNKEERVRSAPLPTAKHKQARSGGLVLFAARAGVVLALGAVVFSVVAFASIHLLFTQTVDGIQSASAGYSLK